MSPPPPPRAGRRSLLNVTGSTTAPIIRDVPPVVTFAETRDEAGISQGYPNVQLMPTVEVKDREALPLGTTTTTDTITSITVAWDTTTDANVSPTRAPTRPASSTAGR